MADDQSESPLIDMAKGIYKGANDLINKIPSPAAKQDPHQQAIDQMNKQANDQRVQDANKTYIPTQTAAQKKGTPSTTPGKIMTTKAAPRKKM